MGGAEMAYESGACNQYYGGDYYCFKQMCNNCFWVIYYTDTEEYGAVYTAPCGSTVDSISLACDCGPYTHGVTYCAHSVGSWGGYYCNCTGVDPLIAGWCCRPRIFYREKYPHP